MIVQVFFFFSEPPRSLGPATHHRTPPLPGLDKYQFGVGFFDFFFFELPYVYLPPLAPPPLTVGAFFSVVNVGGDVVSSFVPRPVARGGRF